MEPAWSCLRAIVLLCAFGLVLSGCSRPGAPASASMSPKLPATVLQCSDLPATRQLLQSAGNYQLWGHTRTPGRSPTVFSVSFGAEPCIFAVSAAGAAAGALVLPHLWQTRAGSKPGRDVRARGRKVALVTQGRSTSRQIAREFLKDCRKRSNVETCAERFDWWADLNVAHLTYGEWDTPRVVTFAAGRIRER